jgi:hypothetical protein
MAPALKPVFPIDPQAMTALALRGHMRAVSALWHNADITIALPNVRFWG